MNKLKINNIYIFDIIKLNEMYTIFKCEYIKNENFN